MIAYINELKERVESLEKKKEALQLQIHSQLPTSSDSTFPIVEVRELCSGIVHVTLISSVDRNVMLNEIIGIVEEEGGEAVSASFSTLGDKVFHSLHIEVSRVRNNEPRDVNETRNFPIPISASYFISHFQILHQLERGTKHSL